MILCVCKMVTEGQVDRAVAQGADTVAALGEKTGAGTDCGCCVKALAERTCLKEDAAKRKAVASSA